MRFERKLVGRRVDELTTCGKAMLTRFEGGLSVYTHTNQPEILDQTLLRPGRSVYRRPRK